jgi:hypothetical protein
MQLNQPSTLARVMAIVASILVGALIRAFDRAIEENQSLTAGQLVTLDTATGYWRKSTAWLGDKEGYQVWVGDTEFVNDNWYGFGKPIAVPGNNHWYVATTPGISSPTTEPTWPTNGSTVKDWADAVTFATNHAYSEGDVVKPTVDNGRTYICTTAGTSHAANEPTWPTDLTTVTSGTAVFTDRGAYAVWADQGAYDTLDRTFGVVLESVTSGADEHPVVAIMEAGAVSRAHVGAYENSGRARVGGIPETAPVGYRLDLLTLC